MAVVHGAYSVLALRDRAAEIAADVQERTAAGEVDRAAVDLLAVTLARIEAASAALDAAPDERKPALQSDLRAWVRLAGEQLDSLGLSPSGRARIQRDSGVALGAAGVGAAAFAEVTEQVGGAALSLQQKLAAVMSIGRGLDDDDERTMRDE